MKIELNPKYEPLFSAPKSVRYFIVTGGRGSAKSFGVSTFDTLLTYERNQKTLFTRYTMNSARTSIIPEFEEKIEIMGRQSDFKINSTDIQNITTGSSIIFSGIKTSSGNQTAKLKSIQGVNTWILDEAEELTDEDVFDKIDLSIRTKEAHNRVILIMNPATKEHWIYRRFFESKGVTAGFNGIVGDTCYIHTTYLDNKEHLDESFLRQVDDIKESNPKKYEHIILGGWLDKSEGVIYSNWTFGDFDDSLPYGFGQDFGYSIDPTTLVKVAIDNKKKLIYLDECYGKAGLSTDQIHQHNLSFADRRDLIVADSAEQRLIAELKARGENIVPTTKGADSVRSGIKLVQDYKLILSHNSQGIARELNNYAWSDKNSETPIDAYNHFCDAFRYYVMHQLKNPNKGRYVIR